MTGDLISRYLEALRRRLPKNVPLAEQTVAEAERELRATAARLQAAGHSATDAAARALARVPTAEAVAGRIALDATTARAISWPFATLISAIVVAAIAAGAAILWLTIAEPEAGLVRAASEALLALAVAGHGALLMQLVWRPGGVGAGRRILVALGGVALAVAGIGAAILTPAPQAWEPGGAVRALALLTEGLAGLWIAVPQVWSPWLE